MGKIGPCSIYIQMYSIIIMRGNDIFFKHFGTIVPLSFILSMTSPELKTCNHGNSSHPKLQYWIHNSNNNNNNYYYDNKEMSPLQAAFTAYCAERARISRSERRKTRSRHFTPRSRAFFAGCFMIIKPMLT